VRTRDSVSLIPIPHSSSSSSPQRTRRIPKLQRCRWRKKREERATTVILSLPHISTTICPPLSLSSISAFCIPTPARPYPGRIHRRDLIVDLAARTRLHCLHLDPRVPMEQCHPRRSVIALISMATTSRNKH
jgi:hypothetical protein